MSLLHPFKTTKKVVWPGGHVIEASKQPYPLDSYIWVWTCKYCGETHEEYSTDIESRFSNTCPLDTDP